MATKKKVIIAVSFVLFILIMMKVMSLTRWDNTALFPVSRVVREVIAPAQAGVTNIGKGVNDFFAYFTDNKVLREENNEMAQSLAVLQEEVYRLQAEAQENERLKELLAYKEQKEENYELVLAGVIARDPGNWYKTLLVNKGTADGIAINMPVVNHDGLVGIVTGVSKNTAEILMLLDSEAAVGSRIFETRVTPGVIEGTGRSDYLRMIDLPHDVEIDLGQTVVTSGLGEFYPKGIRVGTVAEVILEPNGLMKTALVKPFVDFARLEEVFIIKKVMLSETDFAGDVAQ